ncbi:MAG: phosphatase PAP2 family protein [Leptolyngbyaceae cyanobacterium bins.302]|nr:phosphatase PAP2 family protein [Leptolyngbyaceae cyanobacterium bins.302]
MLKKIQRFWFRYVSARMETLTATVGVAGLASCLIALWVAAKLCREVWEREAFGFDESFLLWLHQFASPALDSVMLALTQLGNPAVVTPLACIILGLLVWQRHWQEATFFAIACLGATILNTGLKLVFNRIRPDLWQHLIVETSFSFPSGHALGSVVLYGAIAYLLSQTYPQWSKAIYALAGMLTGAISLSRLYLGVHWLTDVIAGISIGFLWLTICITMLKLQRLKHTPSPLRNEDRSGLRLLL